MCSGSRNLPILLIFITKQALLVSSQLQTFSQLELSKPKAFASAFPVLAEVGSCINSFAARPKKLKRKIKFRRGSLIASHAGGPWTVWWDNIAKCWQDGISCNPRHGVEERKGKGNEGELPGPRVVRPRVRDLLQSIKGKKLSATMHLVFVIDYFSGFLARGLAG